MDDGRGQDEAEDAAYENSTPVPDVKCHCVSVVQDLLNSSEYLLCVEYGAAVLAQQVVGELSLTENCEVLHCVAAAFTRLGEIEHARGALALLERVVTTSRHWHTRIERHKWLVRLHVDLAELHVHNGEREEAVQQYVLAWRHQSHLFGPESLRCLRTFVTVAELKLQLMLDHEASTMLEHAARIIQAPEQCLSLWVTIRRLQAMLQRRQRKFTAAVLLLQDVMLKLEGAMPALEPAEHKQAMIELGSTALQCCEIEVNHMSSPESLKSAFEHFARAHRLLKQCFPPTHPLLINANLRLAQLYAHRGIMDSIGGSSVASTSRGVNASICSSAYFHQMIGDEAAADPKLGLRKAKEIVEQVLDQLSQEEVRGAKHIHTTIDVLDALGDLQLKLEEPRAAAHTFGRALSTSKQLFAPDHERCALLQHRLAEALVCTGHCEDAFHLLQELREWCLLCPAGRMPPVPLVVLQHSIANALRMMERFGEAETNYLAALANKDCDYDTRSKILGNLAALKLTIGDVPSAISFNKQALTLRLGHHGPHSIDVAASYGNLADLCCRNGELKEAIAYADKCMTTVEQTLPSQAGDEAGRMQVDKYSKVKLPPHVPPYRQHPFFLRASSIKASALRQLRREQFRKTSHQVPLTRL